MFTPFPTGKIHDFFGDQNEINPHLWYTLTTVSGTANIGRRGSCFTFYYSALSTAVSTGCINIVLDDTKVL